MRLSFARFQKALTRGLGQMARVNRSVKWFCILGLVLLLPRGSAQESFRPVSPQDGMNAAFLEQLSQLKEDQIAFRPILLEITQRAREDLLTGTLDFEETSRGLDEMVKDLAPQLSPEDDREKIVTTLNRYLFEDQKFHADASKLFSGSLETLLLSSVLKTKAGNCLSLSLIYLYVSDALELPIYGVMLPEHFFVRYGAAEDSFRNIETTDQGRNLPNPYYLKEYARGYQDAVVLKNLTKRQVIAVYLSNLANHYKLRGQYPKAILMFQTALKLSSEIASIHTNFGNVLERSGRIEEAIEQYHHSLELNPAICETHNNLGLAHLLYTRQFLLALRIGRQAKELGCRLHPDYERFLKNSPQA